MAIQIGVDPHCGDPVFDEDDYVEVRAGEDTPPGQVENEKHHGYSEILDPTLDPVRMRQTGSFFYHRDCYKKRLRKEPPEPRDPPGQRETRGEGPSLPPPASGPGSNQGQGSN